jgi:hypothetical protein
MLRIFILWQLILSLGGKLKYCNWLPGFLKIPKAGFIQNVKNILSHFLAQSFAYILGIFNYTNQLTVFLIYIHIQTGIQILERFLSTLKQI